MIEFHVHREDEHCTFLGSRDKVDVTVEVFHDLLRDVETKAHLLAVAQQQLLLVLVTEHLENGFLVLLVDSRALVVDNAHELLPIPIVRQVDVYFSVMAIVDGILDDIDAHLLDSVGVPDRMPRQQKIALLRELDQQWVLLPERLRVIHFSKDALDGDHISQVEPIVKVGVEIHLQLILARHEVIDVLDDFLETEADVSPSEVAQLNCLPVLHVIQLEDNRLALEDHGLKVAAQGETLVQLGFDKGQLVVVDDFLAAVYNHLKRHSDFLFQGCVNYAPQVLLRLKLLV